MREFNYLRKLAERKDFREYVRKVFAELRDKAGITFEEIIKWLSIDIDDPIIIVKNPTRKDTDTDTYKLYDFVTPCSVIPLKNKSTSVSTWFIYDKIDGSRIEIQKRYSVDIITVEPYGTIYSYVFNIYDFVACLSENFEETYDIFKDILNEGGIN